MEKQAALGCDFAETRSGSSAYLVDKTLFIRDFIKSKTKVSLITRPRRFGKSFNLSMLYYFLTRDRSEEHRALFQGLDIESAVLSDGQSCMAYQGKYPVIYLTLKDLKATDLDAFMRSFGLMMSEQYDLFRELEDSPHLSSEQHRQYQAVVQRQADASQLERSLWRLTQLLHSHYGKGVVVLIDEYDTPLQEAYATDHPFHEALLSFFRVWLGSALKDNRYLERGLLTGILRVALINLFSGVNSIPVYSVLDKTYGSYFGFTEAEVHQLFSQSQLAVSMEGIRHWYNGYTVGDDTLYNPWSILNCLDEGGVTSAYWSGSGNHGALAKAMLSCQDAEVMTGFTRLISGERIEVPVDELTLFSGLGSRADSVWGLMVYAGYLSCEHKRIEDQTLLATVRVPNEEVMQNLRRVIRDWVSYSTYPQTRSLAYAQESTLVDSLVLALEQGNVRHLEQLLHTFMMEVASYYDFHQQSEERFYHVFLLGLMVLIRDRYTIASNKEVGLGRFDLALAPTVESLTSGILIEIKRVHSHDQLALVAEHALNQMVAKRYHHFFASHPVQRVLFLGLAFFGKELAIAHAWVDFPRDAKSS